jgi:hypothetical protein
MSLALSQILCVQDERKPQIEQIIERGQPRPANWAKVFPPVKLTESDIRTPKDQWKWRALAKVSDLTPTDAGTTYVNLNITLATTLIHVHVDRLR